MFTLRSGLLASVVAIAAATQSADTLLQEKRLSVHTLLREDIFAGFRTGNMARQAAAEQNIEVLLKERPEQRANLVAWRGGTRLSRAVRAHEAGQAAEFDRLFAAAAEDFAESSALAPADVGVAAIVGGSMAVFADRLPGNHRAAAWSRAYDNYATLWRLQGSGIEKLPVHHRGEILAGLTQSAQRTGRSAEATETLDKMLTLLAGTPYEVMAKQWKADPSSAATSNLTCKNCHTPGRLANRLEALKQP